MLLFLEKDIFIDRIISFHLGRKERERESKGGTTNAITSVTLAVFLGIVIFNSILPKTMAGCRDPQQLLAWRFRQALHMGDCDQWANVLSIVLTNSYTNVRM